MLVLCFFLCIFAILNTSCVNSSAIMGFRGIKKQQQNTTSYILFHPNLYNFKESLLQHSTDGERKKHYNFKFLAFIISLCKCGKSLFKKSNCFIVRYTPLIVDLPLMNCRISKRISFW